MTAYYSETGKVREFVEKYCKGFGLDIGCGIEKITPAAIGIDYPKQYLIDDHPETVADYLMGWEEFFRDWAVGDYDYIYSSHLIEDYPDPYAIMELWHKYLKPEGYLVLVLPIEELYQKHGVNHNSRHQNQWTGAMDFYSRIPEHIKALFTLVEYSPEPIHYYNFYIVLRRNDEKTAG